MQVRAGIIPPINITPAGAAWYSQFVADSKRLQAEEMVTREKDWLKEAGFSPKQIENRESSIREKAFGQVAEEWKQERAEAYKNWQESKAVNSFQTFAQNQPELTQSEAHKISSPENSTKLESDQATSRTADKPYGPVLVLNNNGNVRRKHQEPKNHQESKPTPENPKVEQKAQSTATPQVSAENKPSDSKITTKQLEIWLENAKDIGKSEEYQNHIKKVIEEHNSQGKPISEKTVQALEKDTKTFLATYSEIESRYAAELRQSNGTQSTKNGQQPQQLQEITKSSPEKQQSQVSEQQSITEVQNGAVQKNGAVQNGATPQRTNKTEIENKGQERVSVQDLKQWRKEAEALEIHRPNYLNKIDKLTELAEQKVGSDGRVTLKEPDGKRMQADRQEFKELAKGEWH